MWQIPVVLDPWLFQFVKIISSVLFIVRRSTNYTNLYSTVFLQCSNSALVALKYFTNCPRSSQIFHNQFLLLLPSPQITFETCVSMFTWADRIANNAPYEQDQLKMKKAKAETNYCEKISLSSQQKQILKCIIVI